MRRILTGLMFIALVGAPVVHAAGFVFVATPLDNDDIALAEDLATDIPNCTAIGYWDETSQSWSQHIAGLPLNNFAVETSMPFMASVSADGIWTLCGGVPDSSSYIDQYNIVPGFSTIMLPLNMTYYSNADEVIQTISSCNVIAYWDAASQSWSQHIQGLPLNNFAPRVGYPYMLSCTGSETWPSTLPPARIQPEEQEDVLMKMGTRNTFNLNSAPVQDTDR